MSLLNSVSNLARFFYAASPRRCADEVGAAGGGTGLTSTRSTLGLEFDELARDVVAAAMRQNPQHGPAGLVELNAARERAPQRTAGPLHHVAHLQDGQADDAVLARETVVANAQVEFVQVWIRLAAEWTADNSIKTTLISIQSIVAKQVCKYN